MTIVDDAKTLTEKMKTLPTKNKISVAYMECLLNWLQVCLDKMQKKTLQDKAHSLMGMLLTVAVYRIPDFNCLVMQLLERGQKEQTGGEEHSAKVNEIDA